jgi:hypothetical protein
MTRVRQSALTTTTLSYIIPQYTPTNDLSTTTSQWMTDRHQQSYLGICQGTRGGTANRRRRFSNRSDIVSPNLFFLVSSFPSAADGALGKQAFQDHNRSQDPQIATSFPRPREGLVRPQNLAWPARGIGSGPRKSYRLKGFRGCATMAQVR